MRRGQVLGFGRIDFLTVYEGRLMKRAGMEFFTGRNINDIGNDAEEK